MSIDKAERLKNAILSEYKSIREFSKIVDIPNSTIVSAIENGIGGMAVDKVIRICDVLNLDIKTFDKLLNIKTVDNLSQSEAKLINNYNKLNDLGQHEASKRVEELTYIDKYKKESNITELPKKEEVPEHLILDAANTIDGASEEDKCNDDNTMDDPNF